jgi:chemotaxis protein CheC
MPAQNNQIINFNADQMDVLKEFMNIALGETTASLANILDAFGTMHIPTISVKQISDLQNIIEESLSSTAVYFVTKQLFASNFGGECIFLMDTNSAKNLADHIFANGDSSDEEINDAVLEITNVITSTIISRLTAELDTQVQFFAPSTQLSNSANIIESDELNLYSTVIIVSTMLEFKDQNFYGYIYILTKDEAIKSLQDLIDRKLEELLL